MSVYRPGAIHVEEQQPCVKVRPQARTHPVTSELSQRGGLEGVSPPRFLFWAVVATNVAATGQKKCL